MPLLIKYRGNWADEMYLSGYRVFTKQEWDDIVDGMPDEPTSKYVGSNQEINYINRADQLSHFEVTEITDEEASILARLNIPRGIFAVRSDNY